MKCWQMSILSWRSKCHDKVQSFNEQIQHGVIQALKEDNKLYQIVIV